MNWLQRIVRFLARAVGLQFPPARLEADGPLTVPVTTGQLQSDAAAVIVIDGASDEPLANAMVRYRVLDGPMTIGSQETTEATVQTDADGRASIPAIMSSRGNGLLAVELPGGISQPLVFILRTEGMVHQLNLYSPPSYTAESGQITARIVALDHQDHPVPGAELVFEGHIQGDHSEQGSVTETGGGIYEGTFQTHLAGEWLLVAQDRATHVTAQRCVHVVPGSPEKIELLDEPDPRAEPPYDQVILRAYLLDAYDNPLPPERLTCKMGNTALERWIIGDEARFPLRFIGHGNVDLVLADQEGSTAMEFTVPFAAIWMVNPGVVEPGNSFQTEVLAAPTAEGALNKANIKISFDQERASYVGVSPVTESELPLIIDARLEANELSIDVSSETGIRAQDWPGGIPICMIEWNCLEKGTTCFDIAGTMSPEVDGWRLCMEQKAERENIQCICVNIIYKAWRRQDRRTGTAMVRQAVRVIGNNTYFCCPILHYDWNICEITGSMWLSITQLWGGNQEPWTAAEIAKLLDADDLCKQDDCINLYVLPIGNPNISGRSNIGSPGNMMIDPADFSTVHNLGAHEIGHALGLEHVAQRYNLMHRRQPHGHYISRDQCETIWRNLRSYPCR